MRKSSGLEVRPGFWDRTDVAKTLRGRDIGALFRLVRQYCGATQDAIGTQTGLSQPDVSKIMRGRRRVEDQRLFLRIAEGLDMPPYARQLLGVARDDEPTTPVTKAPALPRRVGPETADALRGTLAHYSTLDNLLGPRHVIATVTLHLDFISGLLMVARGSAHQKLLGAAASFAEFAGWLHQDAGDVADASRWSEQALEWATEAGDDTMVSYVLTRKSHQATGQRESGRTLALAEAALRRPERITPRTRALAHRQVARGHALSLEARECERALEDARREAARSDDFGPAEFTLTGYCTPLYIEMEAADCMMTLGRTDDAIAVYEGCLAEWPAQFERDRGLHLARLATAYAARREPERACTVAREAIMSVTDTGSERAAEELRRLPGWLGRWRRTDEVIALARAVAALA